MSSRVARMKARLQAVSKSIDDLMNSAVDAAGEERGFTTDEQAQFTALETKANELVKIIAAETSADGYRETLKAATTLPGLPRKAAKAAPAADDEDDDTPEVETKAPSNVRDIRGVLRSLAGSRPALVTSVKGNKADFALTMAITACGIVRQKALGEGSVYDHVEALGYAELATQLYDAKVKALSTLTVGSGAEVMPQSFSTDFIEFLHPMSSILRAGPVRIDLSTGNLRIPGGNTGASASYRTQNSDVAYTTITFKEKALAAKELGAISAIPNELLQRSPLAVAQILKSELAIAYSLTMDYACLRGTGAGNSPIGVKAQMNATQVIDAVSLGVSPSVDQLDSLFASMIQKMKGKNVPQLMPKWIMTTRSALYLAKLRTALGTKAYETMQDAVNGNGTLWGFPVIISNQISDALGVTTDCSEIYLLDMGHIWLGETDGMQMSVSDAASYVEAGVLKSAFSQNQSVIRLLGAHDILMKYDIAGAMATNFRAQ